MSSVEQASAKRRSALRLWLSIVHVVSFESLLKHRPNGGAVILLRTICVSVIVYLLVLTAVQVIDPERTSTFDLTEARLAIRNTIPRFGAIFAAVYVSLYSRFSSQWLYLADLYNQLMASEARAAASPNGKKMVLDLWKAGFLHDACDLHLARKPLFLSLVRRWGAETAIRDYFVSTTPSGREAYEELMRSVGGTSAVTSASAVTPAPNSAAGHSARLPVRGAARVRLAGHAK